MSVTDKANLILSRQRAEDIFPPLAFEDESDMVFLDGGYLGTVFTAVPLCGADALTVSRLQAALNLEFRAGSIVQFSLLSSRDIEPYLACYASAGSPGATSSLHDTQKEVLAHATQERLEFFRQGRDHSLIAGNATKIAHKQVIVSVKLPCERAAIEDQTEELQDLVIKFQESLATAGMQLQRLDAQGYLCLLRRILKPKQTLDNRIDPDRLLRDQILGPGDAIVVKKGRVQINDTLIGVLSVKHLPRCTSLGAMAYLCGDPGGVDNQLGIPHMVTLTIEYPERAATNARVRRTAQAINYQAFGALVKFAPKILIKKEGLDVMVKALDEGERAVRMNLSVVAFSEDQEELSRQLAMLRTYYVSLNLEMAEERHLTWPMFWGSLPLFPDSEFTKQTFRFHTMSYKHAAHFLPVLGEWGGTGLRGGMLLQTRQGMPLLADLYDSPSSYSGMVFAESGAGKSFFTQRLILDYLRQGARVSLIDVGYSYYKLAKYLGGEYIEFDERSAVCLNPFSNVDDIDQEVDVLKALLAKMAAPTDGVDDFGVVALEEAIKSVWGSMGQAMSVTDVAEYLLQQEDRRLKDLGQMLYPFTRNGSHGAWFEGRNNLDFGNNFVVLELEHLKTKKALQQVVLLQLITRIQQDMFLRADGRPSIVIVDEAWDLLSDDDAAGGSNMVARFLEQGYRRARKANGAFLIVTQSLAEAYRTASGKAMANNSPHKFVLQQTAESIEALEKDKMLTMSPALKQALQSVHTVPGKYAELVIMAGANWGVGRLVESPFGQTLFSTKGAARTEVIEAIKAGVPPVQAITQFLEKSRHAA